MIRIARKYSLILFLLLIGKLGIAQDIHFSQYYNADMLLNPALTGYYDGSIRVSGLYRNQWRQVAVPIETNLLGIEKKIISFQHEFGIGLQMVSDRVSLFQLNTNKFLASGSYQRKFANNIFRVGLQGGVVHKRTDFSQQTFPDQWDYGQGVFDQSLANNETTLNQNQVYVDMSMGAAWGHRFNRIRNMFSFAIYHINKPNDQFLNTQNHIPFRHVIENELEYDLNRTVILTPRLLYMYAGGASDMMISGHIEKKMKPMLALLGGLGYRGKFADSDAAILFAGVKYKRIKLEASFDLNVSGLSDVGKRKSSFEIGLIYISPKAASGQITIPCDRI